MNDNDEKNIVKSISILGGTQVVNIGVGIIRNKVVSVLLGAAGMGIMSLYQSTSDIISTISNMGTSTTAVKNISNAYSDREAEQLGFVHEAFKKIVTVTGLIGFLICLLSAPLLSNINFGDYDHIWQFALLSLSILSLQLVAGYTTLLQGCRMFKKMSKAIIVGNVGGLIICIPLYYFFGINAIVPVMVLYPVVNYIVLKKAATSIKVIKVKVTYKEAILYGKNIIKTGFYICLQSLFSLLYIYLIRLFLRENGGLATVGLFSAGMLIVNKYVGLVFSSMGTEYYPRLSSITDSLMFVEAINNQIKRSILLLAPLICSMMLLMPLVVRILFSDEFISIVGMAIFLLSSIGFRIIEWSIGFSFIARGKTGLLFTNEFSFKIYTFLISIFLYLKFGLLGIGISYLISEVIFSVQSYYIASKKWGFAFSTDCRNVFVKSILGILVCLAVNIWTTGLWGYGVSIIIIAIFFFQLYLYLKTVRNGKSTIS